MSEPPKKDQSPETEAKPRAQFDRVLEQASRYFMGKADVQSAAERVAKKLAELEIAYAIVGGLSVAAHGHIRVTQDVDVLLTSDGLQRFKQSCLGRGWVEKFAGSRGVLDSECRVPIDFVLTGDYPGDGEEKPVRFPDPADVTIDRDGWSIVDLHTLIELKLASGMTAPDRPRDLDDVIQLIRANALPREYAERLAPYVRPKFDELWRHAQIRRGE